VPSSATSRGTQSSPPSPFLDDQTFPHPPPGLRTNIFATGGTKSGLACPETEGLVHRAWLETAFVVESGSPQKAIPGLCWPWDGWDWEGTHAGTRPRCSLVPLPVPSTRPAVAPFRARTSCQREREREQARARVVTSCAVSCRDEPQERCSHTRQVAGTESPGCCWRALISSRSVPRAGRHPRDRWPCSPAPRASAPAQRRGGAYSLPSRAWRREGGDLVLHPGLRAGDGTVCAQGVRAEPRGGRLGTSRGGEQMAKVFRKMGLRANSSPQSMCCHQLDCRARHGPGTGIGHSRALPLHGLESVSTLPARPWSCHGGLFIALASAPPSDPQSAFGASTPLGGASLAPAAGNFNSPCGLVLLDKARTMRKGLPAWTDERPSSIPIAERHGGLPQTKPPSPWPALSTPETTSSQCGIPGPSQDATLAQRNPPLLSLNSLLPAQGERAGRYHFAGGRARHCMSGSSTLAPRSPRQRTMPTRRAGAS
jgi:hypothetical protein